MRKPRRGGADLRRRAERLEAEARRPRPRPAVATELELFAPEEVSRPTPTSTTRELAPSGSLLESGPYRYFVALVPGGPLDHRRLIDRETGTEITRGPWIQVFEEACRINGIGGV